MALAGTVSVTGPLWLVVLGAGAEGLGTRCYCAKRREKTTLFTEKARPLMLASGLRRQRPFVGKTARISRTCRATRRPPAQLPPILSSFCLSPAARLSVSLSVCPLSGRPRIPVLRQSHSRLSPTVRAVSWGLPLRHGVPRLWMDTQVLPSCRAQPGPTRRPLHQETRGVGGPVRPTTSRGIREGSLRPKTQGHREGHCQPCVGKKGGGRGGGQSSWKKSSGAS